MYVRSQVIWRKIKEEKYIKSAGVEGGVKGALEVRGNLTEQVAGWNWGTEGGSSVANSGRTSANCKSTLYPY